MSDSDVHYSICVRIKDENGVYRDDSIRLFAFAPFMSFSVGDKIHSEILYPDMKYDSKNVLRIASVEHVFEEQKTDSEGKTQSVHKIIIETEKL